MNTEETESRRVIVYIKKEAARHSQYVAARAIVVMVIFAVLLGVRCVDWKMLNLWGALVEWHSISRILILFAKLLSCWMHPASCAKELIESLDVP
jgi:hypothetical protein